MNAIPDRICIHHTAGALKPNSVEIKAYHFLFDANGKETKGYFSVYDNCKVLTKVVNYAAHCGGGNTKTVGLAICGQQKPNMPNTFTRKSFEAMCKKAAELCYKYGIAIVPENVYTHYEFGLVNPHTTSKGKIDISYIHWEPELKAHEVGDYIRQKIKVYYQRIKDKNRAF